jgi:hypothetical protein
MHRDAGMIRNWAIRCNLGANPALIGTIPQQEYQTSGYDASENSNQKNHPNVGHQNSRNCCNYKKQDKRMSYRRSAGNEQELSHVSTQPQKHNTGDLPPIPESSTALPVLL